MKSPCPALSDGNGCVVGFSLFQATTDYVGRPTRSPGEWRMDIVQRIRSRPNDAPIPTEYLLEETADEIERLRSVIVETTTALAYITKELCSYELENRRPTKDELFGLLSFACRGASAFSRLKDDGTQHAHTQVVA